MKGALTYAEVEAMPYWERSMLYNLLIKQKERENEEYEEARNSASSGSGRKTSSGKRSLLSKPLSPEESHGASDFQRNAGNSHIARKAEQMMANRQAANSDLQARIDARAAEIAGRAARGQGPGLPTGSTITGTRK